MYGVCRTNERRRKERVGWGERGICRLGWGTASRGEIGELGVGRRRTANEMSWDGLRESWWKNVGEGFRGRVKWRLDNGGKKRILPVEVK